MRESISRREVLKSLFVASATSALGRQLWASEIAQSIDPTLGIARFRLSDFPALGANLGSVILANSNMTVGSATRVGNFYPIIINRISASEYVCLSSECRHAGCVVGKFNGDELFQNVMYCPCHETQYDIRGFVVQPPLDMPGLLGARLASYETTVANGMLTVRLPEFGFDIFPTETAVVNGNRLRLTFFSLPGCEYEVRHRARIEDHPSVVPFSQTQQGALAETVLTSPGGAPTIYVAAQQGFFQIALHFREI